jgi:RNA polymerase sigma-70 factor (ECF subfamily)
MTVGSSLPSYGMSPRPAEDPTSPIQGHFPARTLPDEDSRLLDSLTAAKAGNAVAFEAIYRALAPRLLRYARGLVGQDAEDIAAEAWLQIVRDLRKFDGDWDAFRGWAARILRNRAIDHLRAASRRPSRATTLDAIADRPSIDDTEASADESLTTAAAIELIATLPPDQAEAVLLRVVIGLDANSAATVLGKRAGAVRVAAHRGLKTLAKRLDGPAHGRSSNDKGSGSAGPMR